MNTIDLLELLATNWEMETCYLSSIEIDHSYYQAVINIGKLKPKETIPWLLNRIKTNWQWHDALWAIVPIAERPTFSEEMAGRSDLIKQMWSAWGKANGYFIVGSK